MKKPLVNLSTRDVPFSKDFVKFTYQRLFGEGGDGGDWHAQQGERLSDFSLDPNEAVRRLTAILSDPRGAEIALRTRAVFRELLTGQHDQVRKLVARYRFVFVIGAPRTGGTYQVKQLFRAAGVDYRGVGPGLAHDGFPDFGLATPDQRRHCPAMHLVQLAEYLVMADLFFAGGAPGPDGRRLVPKKLTKGIYDMAPVLALFGDRADYVVTIRDPLETAQSTLDKSGGMPEGGRFAVRSAIESWALHEQIAAGRSRDEVLAADYWEVMLDYWRRFHLRLAASGVLEAPTTRVVGFGAPASEQAAAALMADLGSDLAPEPFAPNSDTAFPSRLKAQARKTANAVKAVWRQYGVEPPI